MPTLKGAANWLTYFYELANQFKNSRNSAISKMNWRPDRESNPGARICSPLRHHSAIGPFG